MKKYVADAALIIFSVLFALLISRLYESYKIANDKQVAINKIRTELYVNQSTIERWEGNHKRILTRLSGLVNGKQDSLKSVIHQFKYLNLGLLTNNESLIDAFLTNTAWETSKSTGILSEFDFETTQELTKVYELQEVLMNRSMRKIVDGYFDRSTHNMEQLDLTLLQLQLRFSDLVGQEILLNQFYKDAINHLNQIAPNPDYNGEYTNPEN